MKTSFNNNKLDKLFRSSPLKFFLIFENHWNLSWALIWSHWHVLEFILLKLDLEEGETSGKMLGQAEDGGCLIQNSATWKILRWQSFIWIGSINSSKTEDWLLEWKTTERSRSFCLLSPDTYCQWKAQAWWNEGSLWEIEDHIGITSFFQGFQKSHSH